MNPPTENRLHGLDHLRALAIILVLLFHYRVYYGLPEAISVVGLNELSAFGWSGVDLFFVLSGYLIGDKLLADQAAHGRIRFASFYLNRAFRIIPAYLVVLAIYFSFSAVQEGRDLQPLWKFLTFTQNLPIDLRANTFSHAWSLGVEEHFYLVLPLLLFVVLSNNLGRWSLYLILGIFILGVLIRYGIWAELVEPQFGRRRLGAALKYLYYPTYVRLDGLTMGVAIAALFRYQPAFRDQITARGNMLLFASFAVLVGSYQLFGGNILSPEFSSFETTLVGFPLVSLGYGLLVLSALSPNSILYRLRFKPAAVIASFSYSIYLVHKMTNHWIQSNLPDLAELSDTNLFLACLVAAFAGGGAMYFVVEKPFLALRARLRERSERKYSEAT
jgi:peptidoglycan/LPS O-acetylase OafA/YrhL